MPDSDCNPGHPPEARSRGRRRRRADGSQFAVQVLIALVEESLNPRFFFFFLKARDFSALARWRSRVYRRLQRERGRGRETGGRGRRRRREGKKSRSRAARNCNKEPGAGERFLGRGLQCLFGYAAGARAPGRPCSLLSPVKPTSKERLFKKSRGTRTVTQATMSPDFSPCPF